MLNYYNNQHTDLIIYWQAVCQYEKLTKSQILRYILPTICSQIHE